MTSILEDAQEAIFGARNVSYGHPRDNFGHTAKLWSAHKGVDFTAQEVAEFMVLVKLSRLQNGYHRDSVVDIAGYAGTIERLQEPIGEIAGNTDATWIVDGRQYWANFNDIPEGTAVNSSDEPDSVEPWRGNPGNWADEGDYGTGPWREWIDPTPVPRPARKWNRVRNIPLGVEVTDRDGDFYLRVRNGFKYFDGSDKGDWSEADTLSLDSGDSHDLYAPFDEVVK